MCSDFGSFFAMRPILEHSKGMVGRPIDKEKMDAFDKLCEWLEADVYELLNEYIYCKSVYCVSVSVATIFLAICVCSIWCCWICVILKEMKLTIPEVSLRFFCL